MKLTRLEVEVFNVLFIREQEKRHIVHCMGCARKQSPGLQGFVCLEEYTLDELMQVYDAFVLHTPPPPLPPIAAPPAQSPQHVQQQPASSPAGALINVSSSSTAVAAAATSCSSSSVSAAGGGGGTGSVPVSSVAS
uniref:Lysine-specific demethylase 6A/B-like GATA-like domain-containing protein n=1 Tax=Anopheles melas TaxID=34690 RepID=A0A182UE63_9DIPT